MNLEIGYATHRGRVRASNQDSLGVFPARRGLFRHGGLPLFIVADGMGGYQGGEVASRLATETIGHSFRFHVREMPPGAALSQAVIDANDIIRQESSHNQQLFGMGTTAVAAVIDGAALTVANVGDSRAYLVRGEDIRQITLDHSAVAERERSGTSADRSAPAPGRNVITRAVGRRSQLEVDVFEEQWEPGDALVLCSDGLWGRISDSQIAAVLLELGAQAAALKLLQMAMVGQAPDNISVIVVRRRA